MKTIACFRSRIFFLLILGLLGCSPNGEFVLLNGQKQSIDDYSGQWLVINFWADWCAPCREEVPELNLLSVLGNKLNTKVLGISYDPLANKKMREVVEQMNIKYPVIASEPTPILPFSLPKTLPTNYIINPNGELVDSLIGKQTLLSIKTALEKAKAHYSKREQ